MSEDPVIRHIDSLDASVIEGVGYKPERHTGINPNWDACFLGIFFTLFSFDAISKMDSVESLKTSNENLYSYGGWALVVLLFIVGLCLMFPYMKLRDRIFPPREFLVYVGVGGTKRLIASRVSKKRAETLCCYMVQIWNLDSYQTEWVK